MSRALNTLNKSANAHALTLAGIGHDLQTLLTRIRLAIELLNVTERDLVAAIHQDIVASQAIIDQLLNNFRPAKHHCPVLPMTRYDLNALINEEIVTAEKCYAIAIVRDLSPGGLWVEMQALSIKRALTNLLVNALRYGKGWVQISSGGDANTVWFQVEDDGPGIPHSQQRLLLQPFVRGGGSEHNSEMVPSHHIDPVDGHGLGLAILKRIVDSHCGTIQLARSERDGLKVQVILPCQQITTHS